MNKSSWDFAYLLKTVSEVRQNQHINDNDRIAMLREMQSQLPDAMFAPQSQNSRNVVVTVIEEAINACTKSTSPKKPKQSGKRQSTVESTKEKLLSNANGNPRGSRVKKAMVN